MTGCSISHDVQCYFPGLWGVGISGAISYVAPGVRSEGASLRM